LDPLRTVAAITENLPEGVDLWLLLVLAASFALLLLLVSAMVVIISLQSRRLRRMSRHLRELSSVVERHGLALEHLGESLKKDLAPVSTPGDVGEDSIPGPVQSLDDPIDVREQLNVLREAILKAAQSKD
jgi:hypothetical protein